MMSGQKMTAASATKRPYQAKKSPISAIAYLLPAIASCEMTELKSLSGDAPCKGPKR